MKTASSSSSSSSLSYYSFRNRFTTASTEHDRRGLRRKKRIVTTKSEQKVVHFVNLKNGIEALPMIEEEFCNNEKRDVHFLRIQSTLCERGDVEKIMKELDANFLINLALGNTCVVYDYGSRSEDGCPRAFWYGLEFIKYCVKYEWFGDGGECVLRGKKCTQELEMKRTFFDKSTKRKIRYYRQFVKDGSDSDSIKLIGAYKHTSYDGNAEFYQDRLREWHNNKINDSNSVEIVQIVDEVNTIEERLESLGFNIFRGGSFEKSISS
jgi:hypothetical protein